MVAIKDMEMPKGCQHCRFFRKHMFGNGLDYSYSCDLGATDFPMPWIRQMEERASDCPLVEIEERKHGKWEHDKLFGECAYVCSFCHTIWTSSEIQNMHYCPTCGAEMVGVENE